MKVQFMLLQTEATIGGQLFRRLSQLLLIGDFLLKSWPHKLLSINGWRFYCVEERKLLLSQNCCFHYHHHLNLLHSYGGWKNACCILCIAVSDVFSWLWKPQHTSFFGLPLAFSKSPRFTKSLVFYNLPGS